MSAVGISVVSLPARRLPVSDTVLSPTPASVSSQQHLANNHQHLLPHPASSASHSSSGHGSNRSTTPLVSLSTSEVNRSQVEHRETKAALIQLSPAASDNSIERGNQSPQLKNIPETKEPSQETTPVSLESPESSDEPMEGLIPSSDAQAPKPAGSASTEYRPPPMASNLKNILAPDPEEPDAHPDIPEPISLKRPRSPSENNLPSDQGAVPSVNTAGSHPSSMPNLPQQSRTFRQQHKGLSSLLGPSFEDWKFSEEALIQALHLKAEQERTKQEFYRLENRKKLLDLLNAAARAGVPGPAIPSMLGCSIPSPPPSGGIERTAVATGTTGPSGATVNPQTLSALSQQPVAKTMVAPQVNGQRLSLPNASLIPTAVPYLPQTGLTQAAVSSQHAASGSLSGLNQGLKGPPARHSSSMMASQTAASNNTSPPIQIVNFEEQQSPARFRPTHARSASAMPFGATRPITQAYYARAPLQGGIVAMPGPAPAPPANNIQFHHWRPDQQTREKSTLSPRREHRETQHETREGYPGPAVHMADSKNASNPPSATSGHSSRSSTGSRDFASSLPENPHAVKRRSFAGHTRYRSETVLPRFESWYGRNDNEGVSLLANMASERAKHSLDAIMDKNGRRHSASEDASASNSERAPAATAQELPPPVQGTASKTQPSPVLAQAAPSAPKQEVLQPAIDLEDERLPK